MTKINLVKQKRVRANVRDRIDIKRLMSGASEVMGDINKAIEGYPDLSMREQDFAFRYVMEFRTYVQWASYYHCSYGAIHTMMHNTRVRQLMEEIKFDIRKYAIGMRLVLYRSAMQQYLDIFEVPNVPDALEPKRKAAAEIMKWFGIGEGVKPESELNVNLFAGSEPKTEKAVGPDADVKTVEEIKKELARIEQLEQMKVQINKYDDKEPPKRRLGSFSDD